MLSRMFLFFLLFSMGLYAVDGDISVYPIEKEQRFVSEEVVLKVNLKTTAFSIKDAKIALENTQDYIVVTPTSAAFLATVDINGTQWQVVYYEYKLYPLHAGKITVAPIDISFKASMGYGTPDHNFTFKSGEIVLDIVAPQGAGKDDFVLSTPSYALKSEVTPKFSETNVTTIKVGDVIEIQIRQEAKNIPDILFEPVSFSENEHIKIYREEPKLKSETVGNETRATRIDSFTFVASKEGNVSIPAQTFIWWDTDEKTLHTEKTAALHFIVLPAPQSNASLAPSGEDKDKPSVLSLLVILILIAVLYKLIPTIQKKKAEKKLAYSQSEEGRFKTLLHTCQGNDTAKLYHDFYYWLDVADPTLSRVGFSGIIEVQPSFSASLQELDTILAMPEQEFNKEKFSIELKKLRETLLQHKKNKQQGLPSNINPV